MSSNRDLMLKIRINQPKGYGRWQKIARRMTYLSDVPFTAREAWEWTGIPHYRNIYRVLRSIGLERNPRDKTWAIPRNTMQHAKINDK